MMNHPEVFDLHAHPSLKVYLWNKKLYKKYRTGSAWDPLTMRVDLPKMRQGGVKGCISSAYLPEKAMINDCPPLRTVLRTFGIFSHKFRQIYKGDPFDATINIIDIFEKAVAAAQAKGWKDVFPALSAGQLRQGMTDNKTVILHAVEGGHSLGGKLENIKAFFDRGVCMLTLAHFYQNEVTHTVGGIPAIKKHLCCFRREHEQRNIIVPYYEREESLEI